VLFLFSQSPSCPVGIVYKININNDTKKADYDSEDGQQRSEKQKSEEKGTV
jgi:polyferredoxin